MIELYNKMFSSFNGTNELVSVYFEHESANYNDCIREHDELFNYVIRSRPEIKDVLIKRMNNEYHFHSYLEHQLFSRLQEIKYYSSVDINNSRRIVSVSSDCISAIQILIRDKIYVNTYFRSSDFDGAFPADLGFIASLPFKLMVHLKQFIGVNGYGEIDQKFLNSFKEKRVSIHLIFGSLHRTTV